MPDISPEDFRQYILRMMAEDKAREDKLRQMSAEELQQFTLDDVRRMTSLERYIYFRRMDKVSPSAFKDRQELETFVAGLSVYEKYLIADRLYSNESVILRYQTFSGGSYPRWRGKRDPKIPLHIVHRMHAVHGAVRAVIQAIEDQEAPIPEDQKPDIIELIDWFINAFDVLKTIVNAQDMDDALRDITEGK